jgi:hypothetical protein
MTQTQILGAFLRAHRERLKPASLGLPATSRRRTPGLRREEVAQLCAVSTTWYTWLEQGRPISCSAHVLARIAGALQLSAAEREYMFELAQLHDGSRAEGGAERVAPDLEEWVRRASLPTYVLDRQWNALAWNRPASLLFRSWLGQGGERNLLRFIFLDPAAREMIVDWNNRARRVVAEFRADAGRHLLEPPTLRLVEGLKQGSRVFAKWWSEQDVRRREGGSRSFRTPRGAILSFTQVALTLCAHSDLKVVTLVPQHAAQISRRSRKA